MKRTLALSVFLAVNLLLSPAANVCCAQTTPFLSDEEIRTLSNEISGDRAFEHIRWLSHWHRDSGMEGFFKARDYVMQAARDAGARRGALHRPAACRGRTTRRARPSCGWSSPSS